MSYKKSFLRVLVLVPSGLNGRGGIDRQMLYLSREFSALEGSILFIPFRTRYNWVGWLRHISVLPRLFLYTAVLVFRRIDIVHFNLAPKGSTFRKAIFFIIAKFLGRKCIIHLHGSGYDAFFLKQSKIIQSLIAELFRRSDKIVVLGAYWDEFVRVQMGLSADRLVIIENGVPRKTSMTLPNHLPTRFLFLGQVGVRKGIPTLLDALSQKQMKKREWVMVIAGDGENDYYQQVAIDLGLGNRVHFLGWVSEDEVTNLLNVSDVLILPSTAENQPVSIIEAMAQSRPVVSTPVGAIPELVLNGLNGYLIPVANSGALADAMARLADNPELRVRFGRAGLKIFNEKYDIRRNAQKFGELYRSLMR